MNIAPLGYSPANKSNQNYKNKQQNPSFKSSLVLTAKNPDLNKYRKLVEITHKLSDAVAEIINYTGVVIGKLLGSDPVLGVKGTIELDKSYGNKPRIIKQLEALIERYKKEIDEQNLGFSLEFQRDA